VLDGPQLVAILFVLAGAFVLRSRQPARTASEPPGADPVSTEASHG
jgi:hypothetical protein